MIIQSKNVWLHEDFVAAQLTIEGDKIIKIEEYNKEAPDVDYGENYILPGFIDIHSHGYGGISASKSSSKELVNWKRYLPEEGVTSFLPAVETQSEADNIKAYKNIVTAMSNSEGAEILGIYMEGNFISEKTRGAQCKDFIVKPSIDVLKRYIDASNNNLKLICIAPEEDEGFKVCEYASSKGIRVSVGHSNATYKTVKDAMNHGAVSITHTYNGCPRFHHREVGVIGAAMDIDDLYTEIIGDGRHVSWEAVRILGRLKGKDKLILVSDAFPLKGYKGELPLGITRTDDGQFVNNEGNLCGSSLKINEGINNLIKKAKLPLVTAINSATINPAKMLGINNNKGSIEINKDADLVITNSDFKVMRTYCKGREVYKGE